LSPWAWSVSPTNAGSFNNSGDITTTFTPNQTFLNNSTNKQITLKFSTKNKPNGACNPGEDELILFLLDTPTATLETPPEICTGSSTNLTVTGTPNTKVTYKKDNGSNQIINLNSSGTGTIESGIL